MDTQKNKHNDEFLHFLIEDKLAIHTDLFRSGFFTSLKKLHFYM